jgi:hypothetical protein
MSSLNRLIAESLGWTDYDEWGYCNRDWGEVMRNPATSEIEFLPDYEHDLNITMLLYWMLPEHRIGNDGDTTYIEWLEWQGSYGHRPDVDFAETIEDFCRAICEAYCRWKNIVIPKEVQEGEE